MSNHYWIRADRRADRQRAIEEIDLPPVLAIVDAHRRLRGPYTAANALLRSIAGDALRRCPELGSRHNIEISTCAPELASAVPPVWTSLEWMVGDSERTRFYSRLHTLNISNGLAELLRDYLSALGGDPRALIVENMHDADPTDQELVAVLLRRTDLGPLTIVVGTGVDRLADPPGEIAVSLMQTLLATATPVDAPSTTTAGGEQDPAQAYIDSDGTSDDPTWLAAYERLAPNQRAMLHDERRATLASIGEPSLLLGAVPYHAERGSDPAGAGLTALKDAIEHCRGVGLYQAAADLGLRARAIVDRATQPELWWHFTDATSISLASLGRADEAESIYDEARAATSDPLVHMELAYGMAMLHARHYPEERRDYPQARAWMNVSIAIASLLEDPKKRAFHSVFGRNGLALVEVRQNNSTEALRLLEEGIATLDRELEQEEQALHRVVLRYNRAQVLGMMGRLEEALADYSSVVEIDPDFPEHHFNIGNILRRLGRNAEAVAAYETALRKSPPFPEAYYNRADARLEMGDTDGALADFGYTIQLDPQRVDAHVNLAGLLCELGDIDAAWRAVTAGLALAPDNAHLLCIKARLLAERGHAAAARDAVTAALAQNAQLGEAWALRADLSYAAADLEGAAADYDRAVELTDELSIRFNRAVIHQVSGRYAEAASDYEAVLASSDDPDARARLQLCRRQCRARAS